VQGKKWMTVRNKIKEETGAQERKQDVEMLPMKIMIPTFPIRQIKFAL
jgi:hypothetical protein